METVTVNAAALRQLLEAVMGPAHLIRELRVIQELHQKKLSPPDPITILVEEYNAAAEAHNALNKARQTDENS